MVLQKRRAVKRGCAHRPAQPARGAAAQRVAPVWHWIALFFIAASGSSGRWRSATASPRLLHFFIVFVVRADRQPAGADPAAGFAERLMRPSPDMAERYPGLQARLRIYHPVVQRAASGASSTWWRDRAAATLGLRMSSPGSSESYLGRRLVCGDWARWSVTLLLALAAWEAANAAIQRIWRASPRSSSWRGRRGCARCCRCCAARC